MKSETFWQWYEDYAAPRLAEFADRGMDRSGTFRKMFEHLDSFARPVTIIETGCVEEPDNWAGNGCSTILFDRYAATHPGTVVNSFEIVEEKVREASKYCPHVRFVITDSIKGLMQLAARDDRPIDLLYLDASHHDWVRETPSQVHHYRELMAVMPLLREDSLVVVDDSAMALDDYPQTRVIGKGGIIAQYALEVGAKLEFCKYQIGFTRITRKQDDKLDFSDVILRARAHIEAGERLQADWLYRLVVALTPPPWVGKNSGLIRLTRGEACANFGRTAHKMKRYGTAVDWLTSALQVDPLATDYRCDLVRSLVALEAMPAAKREAKIATKISPADSTTWATLGGVTSDMMERDATVAAYDRQIEAAEAQEPNDPFVVSTAYINRAVIAIDMKDYPTAREMCRRIELLRVRAGDAFQLLAMLEYRASNHEKAIELFDKALEADCVNQPLTHWNKSLALASIGRIKEAWQEHIWREHEKTIPTFYIPYQRFLTPRWNGEAGPGTVHVHTEAGHGDNIAMLRFLPLMEEKGLTVHYESDPKLLSLARRCFPTVKCMPRALNYPGALGLEEFDWHMPIGDLPHAFGTDIDTIPWRGPYIKADPDLTKLAAKKIPDTAGRKIGLCWSSGIRSTISIWMDTYGRQKSMPLKEMVPLFENYEDVFVSLQVGDRREEIDHRIYPVIDVLSVDPDWDETAALIENLDLVITVDTGVAHLAGAMGKPTWVVMQRDGASWHFMCEREGGAVWNEHSPWYPSVRVFRQITGGGWPSAIRKVRQALGR